MEQSANIEITTHLNIRLQSAYVLDIITQMYNNWCDNKVCKICDSVYDQIICGYRISVAFIQYIYLKFIQTSIL